ncbi:SDR family NAD(P)-dependent oxidoreductase [Methylobacter sp.]|uniref:SDR family NAD(P)-dependent oxidoreductase n=1 Tax=Methylobacter sp. TaxID=2051955 RepID=UPI002FDE0451
MYIIVGASSGVGRAIAEIFAAKGHDLLLVSREKRDTNAVALDLMLRFDISVTSVTLDLAAPQPDFSEILEAVDLAGKAFKGMLVPAGAVIDTDSLEIEASAIDGLFRVNCLSICSLITEILKRTHKDSAISIVGFGSIASIRGRGANMIYSTAKTAMQFYFESLRHACVGKQIIVQFYVLGYMDTNLAFAYNVPLSKGSPGELAQRVYRDINKDIGVSFFPRYWLIIAMILKLIPWPIYKHLKF